MNSVDEDDKDRFGEKIAPIFARRHKFRPFDIVESAEIYGDARVIGEESPGVPRVVKLHTPSFLLHRIGDHPLRLHEKLRFAFGALKRCRLAWPRQDFSVLRLREKREAREYRVADEVTSPSRSLIGIAEKEWGPRPDGIVWLPNSYTPSKSLLEIAPACRAEPIAFFGRLEIRKGVVELVRALGILERMGRPVNVRFIGAPSASPKRNTNMRDWAATQLDMRSGRYTFTGMLSREDAIAELAECGVVVIPSRWENFPYACAESMAAGRAVVGSASGGMSEMIEDGQTGLLVPPLSPQAIAESILRLVESPDLVKHFGLSARLSIQRHLSPEHILPLQISSYRRAIEKASRFPQG